MVDAAEGALGQDAIVGAEATACGESADNSEPTSLAWSVRAPMLGALPAGPMQNRRRIVARMLV